MQQQQNKQPNSEMLFCIFSPPPQRSHREVLTGWSTSLAITEIQMQMTPGCHFTARRMAIHRSGTEPTALDTAPLLGTEHEVLTVESSLVGPPSARHRMTARSSAPLQGIHPKELKTGTEHLFTAQRSPSTVHSSPGGKPPHCPSDERTD